MNLIITKNSLEKNWELYWKLHSFRDILLNPLFWEIGCLRFQLRGLALKETVFKTDIVDVQQITNLTFFFSRFSPIYDSTFPNVTFASINTQPSNVYGQLWIMIVRSGINSFADSLKSERYSFLKHHYNQIKPKSLQAYLSICHFYTIYAASHLFKFRQRRNYWSWRF